MSKVWYSMNVDRNKVQWQCTCGQSGSPRSTRVASDRAGAVHTDVTGHAQMSESFAGPYRSA